jgi:hypothetical protein
MRRGKRTSATEGNQTPTQWEAHIYAVRNEGRRAPARKLRAADVGEPHQARDEARRHNPVRSTPKLIRRAWTGRCHTREWRSYTGVGYRLMRAASVSPDEMTGAGCPRGRGLGASASAWMSTGVRRHASPIRGRDFPSLLARWGNSGGK